jgi:hypothetical protein
MRKRSYQGGIFLTRIEASRCNLPIEDEDEYDDEDDSVAASPRRDLLFKVLRS